ncbi:hypothetical protein KEM48_014266 [Puccinia striiformis f. sp. tritici PST-130]|nr:hypothetical protein KEM48_014266 [Puccinia striiformis f. sp. tritici PST-130]
MRVNRPSPASTSSPANRFVANPPTPRTPIVHPRPFAGGSQFLSDLTRDLTANRVVIDQRESPPPVPHPRNISLPLSFESSPLAARWSSPSTASTIAGSSSGAQAPVCVAAPPVQGAYDPEDYHLLQRNPIFLLLAPALPLPPFNPYRFGFQVNVPGSMLFAYARHGVIYQPFRGPRNSPGLLPAISAVQG